MPGMNGVDMMRALLSRNDTRPVILLTGHGDIEMAVNAIKGGAFDFIEKPFDPARLITAIGSAIDKGVENKVIMEETAQWRERFEFTHRTPTRNDGPSGSRPRKQGNRDTPWNKPADCRNSSHVGHE